MYDYEIRQPPAVLYAILRDTQRIGFTMASETQTGSVLRTLAASKPGGRLLELGTGTGVGTAWILAGMDSSARLDTVESDGKVLEVARQYLGHDQRVTFHLKDGAAFLAEAEQSQFDFIYADAWPGKFTHLEAALSLIKVGGIYFVDDLLPQANWPQGHSSRVSSLIDDLENRIDFVSTRLACSTGLMILVRKIPA
jgi:predicted O-methyltransferase YrrM